MEGRNWVRVVYDVRRVPAFALTPPTVATFRGRRRTEVGCFFVVLLRREDSRPGIIVTAFAPAKE